jgi:hypothetical protein
MLAVPAFNVACQHVKIYQGIYGVPLVILLNVKERESF